MSWDQALSNEVKRLEKRLHLIQQAYNEASSDIAVLFEHLPQDQEDGSYTVDGQSLTELQRAIFEDTK